MSNMDTTIDRSQTASPGSRILTTGLAGAHRLPVTEDPDLIETPPAQPPSHTASETHPGAIIVPSLKHKHSRWNSIKVYVKNIAQVFRTGPRDPYFEDYRRYIKVEITTTDAKGRTRPICRRGVAMIDPHCPDNVMSRKFAGLFGIHVDAGPGKPAFTTVKGESVHILQEVDVRWYCQENNVPSRRRFGFDPQFQTGIFKITDSASRFDVIIGSDTIDELRVEGRLIGPSFRPRQPKPETVNAKQKEKERKQQEEAMVRDSEAKSQANAKSKPLVEAFTHPASPTSTTHPTSPTSTAPTCT